MNWKKPSALVLSVAVLSAPACSPADRRLSLRDSAEPPEAALSPEAARVRHLQLVRYVDDEGFSYEVTADDFGRALSDCEGTTQCQSQGMSACERAACTLKMKQCEGDLMLAIASGTGSALKVNLDWESGVNATVPPQTAATNAALAEFAAVRFRDAMKYATDILMGVFPYPLPPCTDLGASFAEYSGERPLRDFAAATFLDAFHEGKRAYQVAFKNTLAVSDAELSSTTSLELGRVRAISNDRLSRTAAAHLMVPGVSGWLGSNSEAFCTSGKLTGPQEAALAVLREAAPAPSDVLSRDTDALLHGSETETQFGTIRQRLADAWGVDALPSTKPIWEPYGLTRGDFAAAHAALRDELQIFARTESAILPPRRIPGGASAQFQRFAGTAGQAPERPDHYWASLSQIGVAESPVPEEFWMLPNSNLFDYFDGWAFSRGGPGTTGLSLAEFVEVGYAWARVITDRAALSAFPDTVLNPLRLLLSGEDTRGRLTHCVLPGSSPNIEHDITVAGFDASDRLALVRGEDLMECAVNGHIEGAKCTLPPFLQGPPSLTTLTNPDFSVVRLNYQLPLGVGPYDSAAWAFFTVSNPALPPTALGRYYLIRPRQKGDDTPRAGEWELLLGTPLVNDPTISGSSRCRVVPIVPEAIAAAASAIAPSRDWCGTSEVSCAGTRFDERLPLEDELTGDGDDIESSWKHYLQLARSAVDQADALGQEYIEASLQKDLREEDVEIRRDNQEEKANAAFQRIQEICGSAVKPETVLFLLGFDTNQNLDLSDVVSAQCNPTSSGPPICGMRRSIEENAELGKIKDCLGMLGDRQEMHLGDGHLCVANQGIESCETSGPPCVQEGEPFVFTAPACEACDSEVFHCLEPKDGRAVRDKVAARTCLALPV